jgi:hypothetical protein
MVHVMWKTLSFLFVTLGCALGTATASNWFDEYTTVLTNPQKADYAFVAPD